MKYLFILAFFICSTGLVFAQQNSDTQRKTAIDSTGKSRLERREVGSSRRKRLEYFKDTIRREHRRFDSSLFTDIHVPSTSDYADNLRKIYQFLGEAQSTTESFTKLDDIQDKLENEDSTLVMIKERMSQMRRNFNIRNVQMVNTVLDALDQNTSQYTHYLNQYDTTLDKVRDQIAGLRKDTLMLRIFRDTTLKKTFQPQLQQLKAKWNIVDSLVTNSGQEINTLVSEASAHSITIGELLYEVDSELNMFGITVFGKERPFIWEASPSGVSYSQNKFKESIGDEVQMARFYFSSKSKNRLWLLLAGVIFFYWIWLNFRRLKKLNKLNAIEKFHIIYINSYPVAGSLIFILSLAPFLTCVLRQFMLNLFNY